jgi:hypothetical protein
MKFRLQFSKYSGVWRVQKLVKQYCDLPIESAAVWDTVFEDPSERSARDKFNQLVLENEKDIFETVEEV